MLQTKLLTAHVIMSLQIQIYPTPEPRSLPKFVKVPGELEAKLAAMANGASGVDLGLLE